MNCGTCGAANPADKKFCRQCGSPLVPVASVTSAPQRTPVTREALCAQCGSSIPPGKTFCTNCGAPVSGPSTRPTQSLATAQAAPGSIEASLEKLGIRISRRQLIGFAISVVAGMVVARILPYAYPILLGRILDQAFGLGPSPGRDAFNTHSMTVITFATSFVLSFFATRKRREA